jgi:aspartyl aminopeptidase
MATEQLNEPVRSEEGSDSTKSKSALNTQENHHPLLLKMLAEALSEKRDGPAAVKESDIHDLELSLFDTSPSVVGGALHEFIFSPRLDNLFSSFAACEALALSVEGPQNSKGLEQSGLIRTIALW